MDINDLESFLFGIVNSLLSSGSHIVYIIINSHHNFTIISIYISFQIKLYDNRQAGNRVIVFKVGKIAPVDIDLFRQRLTR